MYIELSSTTTKIDSIIAKNFLAIVQQSGPPSITLDVAKSTLDVQYFLPYDLVDDYTLRVELSRSLTESEFDYICDAWDISAFKYGTAITTPEVTPDTNSYGLTTISDQQYKDIAISLAKSHHATWMQDKLDSGWRYGQYLSLIEKTHPLLLPWEQLPDRFKVPDLHSPLNILNILQMQGFSLVRTSEIEALVKLYRAIS